MFGFLFLSCLPLFMLGKPTKLFLNLAHARRRRPVAGLAAFVSPLLVPVGGSGCA